MVMAMTVNELAEKFNLTAVALPNGDRQVNGCYIGDLLSWVMGKAQCDDAWITIMSNINVIAVASLCDTACIILAENVTLEEEVQATAEGRGINILSSDKSAFELAKALAELL